MFARMQLPQAPRVALATRADAARGVSAQETGPRRSKSRTATPSAAGTAPETAASPSQRQSASNAILASLMAPNERRGRRARGRTSSFLALQQTHDYRRGILRNETKNCNKNVASLSGGGRSSEWRGCASIWILSRLLQN